MTTLLVDHLSRLLAARARRRDVAAALVALTGLAPSAEAGANQGNPCPTCQHHAGNQGQGCVPDRDGTPCLADGACKGGRCLTACSQCQHWTGTRCVPRKNDTPCDDPDIGDGAGGGVCQAGICVSVCARGDMDNLPCGANGRCLGRTCELPPMYCNAGGAACDGANYDGSCCSYLCHRGRCTLAGAGCSCLVDADCEPKSCDEQGFLIAATRRCIGFNCEVLPGDHNCLIPTIC